MKIILITIGAFCFLLGGSLFFEYYANKEKLALKEIKRTQSIKEVEKAISESEFFEIKIKDKSYIRIEDNGKFIIEGREVDSDKEVFKAFKNLLLKRCN